jgi:hypothetical protein
MSIRLEVRPEHMSVATRAGHDFLGFARIALADVLWDGLDAVAWDPERQCVRFIYTPPPGEAAYIAEAIARMVAVRSSRRDVKTGQLRTATHWWWPLVKLNFRPLFDDCRDREVGHGWLDLTLALADWIWTPDGEILIDVFCDRDGELRVDMSGYDVETHARVTAFELLSRHVCSTCGAPGRVYERNSLFAAVVACPAHNPRGDDNDDR